MKKKQKMFFFVGMSRYYNNFKINANDGKGAGNDMSGI